MNRIVVMQYTPQTQRIDLETLYKAYLICDGKKLYTPKGQKSTVYNYMSSVRRILWDENIDWDVLAKDIGRYVALYDRGGAKAAIGAKSNSTVINALKAYGRMAASVLYTGASNSYAMPSSAPSQRSPVNTYPLTDYNYKSVFEFIDRMTNHDPRNQQIFAQIVNEVSVDEDTQSTPYKGVRIDKVYESAKILAELLQNGFEDLEVIEAIQNALKPDEKTNVDTETQKLRQSADRYRKDGQARTADLIEKIHDIICTSFYWIGGTYNHGSKKITLYLKNIGNGNKKIGFAHELFHAYHHYLIDLNGKNPYHCEEHSDLRKMLSPHYECCRTIVKESLASYFEYRYADHYGWNKHAKAVKSRWYSNSVLSYPYAGAKNIIDDNHFYNLLLISIRCMCEVCLELI